MERKSSLKRIFTVMVLPLLLILCIGCILPVAAGSNSIEENPTSTIAPIIKEPVTLPSEIVKKTVSEQLQEFVYVTPQDKEEASINMLDIKDYIDFIYSILPPAYQTDLYVIGYNIAYPNIVAARTVYNQYKNDYNEFIRMEEEARIEAAWAEKAREYPVATQVWRYMKEELGWNDYVCAGVMGNMMTECGGQTLNLQYTIVGKDNKTTYYGLCQWSKSGYGYIHGADLIGQLECLKDTVQREFDNYGYKYQKGFHYDDFVEMHDSQAAALAFAKAYERCNPRWYNIRLINAVKAYEYFVD